jgi:hypothetical protein
VVEEQREGDDWVVRFELPGVDPDRDVVWILRAQHDPPAVDEDEIHARYKDRILEVRIPAPKDEKSEATQIPVDAAVAAEAAGAHRRGSGVASG